MKLLLVEDDVVQWRILEVGLRKAGHEVSVADTLAAARRLLEQRHFDVVLLDRQLGEDDALCLVPEIKRDPTIGIIVMSSLGDPIDRVVGLEVGADDYISKPVEMRELAVRIRRLSERLPQKVQADGVAIVPAGSGVIDLDRGIIRGRHEQVELTALEVRLLRALVSVHGRILSREHLLDHLHGHAAAPMDRSIDICISRLRRKMRSALGVDPIQTVRGLGYRLQVDVG